MLWLRWIVGGALLALSSWLAGLNGYVFWKGCVRREQTSSWIPVLGGGLGVAALTIIPVVTVNRWWWLPLVLDWGSLPGIIFTVCWHVARAKPRSG